MVATEAPSAHSGGVTVFYRVTEQFSVEALQTYGANVVSFQLETGDSWWFILGCDLAPYNASTINDIFAAISKRPQGAALLVVGNFNTKLAAPEGRDQDEGIALCWNLLESTPARIPLIKSSHKWIRMLFIISNSKPGIWL